MKSFLAFGRLPFYKQRMLFKVLGWMLLIQAGLLLSNYNRVQQLLNRFKTAPIAGLPADEATVKLIVWAVDSIGRRLPGLTCLRSAPTAQLPLANRNYPVDIKFGITKKKGRLLAHAWVEKEGEILVGGVNSRAEFIPISIHAELFKRLSAHMR